MPPGVKCGIRLNCDRAAHLSAGTIALFIGLGKPACEVIALTGEGILTGRECHLFAVGVGTTGDIAATVGLKGQGEVSAGVENRNQLSGCLRDFDRRSALQIRIGIGFDRRGNHTVQNALDMLAFNFGISREIITAAFISRKILQQVYKVIFRGPGDIFDAYFTLKLLIKIRFLNNDFLYGRIVDRAAGNICLLRLGCGRNRNGIRQVARLKGDQFRIEGVFRPFSAAFPAVGIEILEMDGIDLHLMKDCHSNKAAIDRSIRGNFLIRILIDPLLKDLALNKGGLRQCANRRAFLRKILGKSDIFLPTGILCTDHEDNLVHVVELRSDGQVLCDDVPGLRLGFILVEPLHKLLALGGRISWQHQRIPVIEGVREIDFGIIQHEGDRKDILLIGSPDIGILADHDCVVKDAIGIGPARNIPVLFRGCRQAVHGIVGAGINSYRFHDRCPVFLIEGHRILNWGVLRANDNVLGHRVINFGILVTRVKVAPVRSAVYPVTGVIIIYRYRRKGSDGLTVLDASGLNHFGIPGYKGHGVAVLLGCVSCLVSDITRHFGQFGIPAGEGIGKLSCCRLSGCLRLNNLIGRSTVSIGCGFLQHCFIVLIHEGHSVGFGRRSIGCGVGNVRSHIADLRGPAGKGIGISPIFLLSRVIGFCNAASGRTIIIRGSFLQNVSVIINEGDSVGSGRLGEVCSIGGIFSGRSDLRCPTLKSVHLITRRFFHRIGMGRIGVFLYPGGVNKSIFVKHPCDRVLNGGNVINTVDRLI